ncbi:hypothetical protein [Roseomonas sp. 18066]|uniref:hypothetical protein n=1 Tax=Roseomonas sp. 18066 TaxID=2681412 RepID=UPI001F48C109|nr:hypothetical protein [Roseomonas sp. 18066]
MALAAAERDRLAQEEAIAAQGAVLASETRRARGDAAEMALWSVWLRAAERRRRGLEAELRRRAAAEELLRDSLREDFAHLKRLELALAQHHQREKLAAARKAEQRAEELELLKPRA